MKKFFALLRNELIKIFSKKSVLFVVALIVLVSLISAMRVSDTYISADPQFKRELETLTNECADYETAVSEYEEAETSRTENEVSTTASSKDKIAYWESKYFFSATTIKLKALQQAVDLGVSGYDDWRSALVFSVIDNETLIFCYEQVRDDTPLAAFVQTTSYVDLQDLSADQIPQEIDKLQRQIDECWTMIRSFDYPAYISSVLTLDQDKLTTQQRLLSSVESMLQTNPYDADLLRQRTAAKAQIIQLEGAIRIRTYIIDHGVTYDSWQKTTIDRMLLKYESYVKYQSDILTSGEFYANDYDRFQYGSYESYMTQISEKSQNCLDAVIIGWYSLENDVVEMSVADSARANILNFTDYFFCFVLFGIFLAGISVASEFQTKTVNFLVTEPAKRWKILTAKLISVLIGTFGVLLLGFFAYYLGTGFTCGFSDLSLPYIYVADSTVGATSFLLWMFEKLCFASLSLLFLVSFAFMLSCITRSAPFALGGSVLLFLSSYVVQLLTLLTGNNIYAYLPFPYFNLASHVFNDLVTLSSSTNLQYQMQDQLSVNLLYGIILLCALTVASIIIAYHSFVRKDVSEK